MGRSVWTKIHTLQGSHQLFNFSNTTWSPRPLCWPAMCWRRKTSSGQMSSKGCPSLSERWELIRFIHCCLHFIPLQYAFFTIHCSTHCLHLNRILQDNCLNCLHYIPLQYAILRCLHFTPYLRCLNSNPFAVRSLYITPHWSTLCLHGLRFTSLQYVLLMLFTLYPIAVRIVNVVYALPHCCTHCLHCLRSTPLQYALLMLFTLYPIAVRIVYIVNVLPHCSTHFLHFTPLQYALYVRCS